jgi:RND family efflux transporter MFP subunit
MTIRSAAPNSVSVDKRKTPWQRIRQHPRRAIGVGAIALLLAIGLPVVIRNQLASPQAEAADSGETTVLPVETLTVEPVDSYEVTRSYTGEIAALRSSDLGFERSGELVNVLVQEGDRVAAGTPLARLDISNLRPQRQQLEAEKARAQARLAELEAGPRPEDIAAAEAAVRELEQELALQQTQRSRREFLYEQGAISRETLDEFAYGQEALQARLDQARSRLRELRNGTRSEQILAQQATVRQLDAAIADLDVTIGKSTLRSPFAGVVSSRTVDEGTVVSAGQPVIELVENAAPEARIGLPANVADRLQIGSSHTIRLGQESYAATVTSVLPEVDADTRTQVVVFQLEQTAMPRLSPGQTARVELARTLPTDGIWLPNAALTQSLRGLWNAYVLIPPDDSQAPASEAYQVQPQTVEILHQDGDLVLVRGTLQPGDRIVASGTHRLVPGQIVRPTE